MFTLCFAPNGGYFSLGGINKTLHSEEIKYIPFYEGSFYRVKLKDVVVNFKDFHINNNDYYTVIDSGTTISYFPKNLFFDFEKQLNIYCSQIDKCLGNSYSTESGICYKLKENTSYEQFISSMPNFYFTFENNVKYVWKPESYLYLSPESEPNDTIILCIGLAGWASNEILLGSTWMHNHDIIFDLSNKKLGFAESRCSITENSFYDHKRKIKKSEYLQNCEISRNIYLNLIYVVIASFTLVVNFLYFFLNNLAFNSKFDKNSKNPEGTFI